MHLRVDEPVHAVAETSLLPTGQGASAAGSAEVPAGVVQLVDLHSGLSITVSQVSLLSFLLQ